MALLERIDGVVDFLPPEDASAFEDLDQRGDPPHVGESKFFQGVRLKAHD